MKIIHTSDWHLGRRLDEFDLREEQRHLVTEELPRIVEEERPDLVIIAGDVYDRRLPPNEAVRILGESLIRLREQNVPVLLIGGNHDTSDILNYMSPVLESTGLHVYGKFSWPISPLVLEDEHGEVAVFPIPYFEPEDVPPVPFGRKERFGNVREAYEAIMDEIRRQSQGRRVVVVAHAYVGGARYAKSEVELEIGGLAQVPVSTFDGIDYVALGHIHRRQAISENIHYSGAIYPYALDEVSRAADDEEVLHKGVLVVEMGEKGNAPRVSFRELVPRRPAVVLRGTVDELLKMGARGRYASAIVLLEVVDGSVEDKKWARLDSRYPNILMKRIVRTGDSDLLDIQMELDSDFRAADTPRKRILSYYRRALGEWLSEDREQILETLLDRAEARARSGEEE